MKFDISKTVNYWKYQAQYDIDTADALFEKKKFPYALFMGHLSLEKLLKALFVRDNQEHAPRTHSLSLLASKLKIFIPNDMLERLAEYMEFYLEGRYPDEQMEFYQKCTEMYTKQKLENIKGDYEWLIKQF